MLEESRIVSVGNFDPLVLASALDFLRIALAPVVTTACERLIKLMQTPFSGLPEGLARAPASAPTPFPQLSYIAAALTGETRLLAQPVSFRAGHDHDRGRHRRPDDVRPPRPPAVWPR